MDETTAGGLAASSSWVRPARTSSTICRRNSRGYGGRDIGTCELLPGPIVPSDQVSTRPGQHHAINLVAAGMTWAVCHRSLSRLKLTTVIETHASPLL